MSISDDPEFNEALRENSAQDIFNALRQLESDRQIHERRWPWELLQNAVDTSRESGVDCTFSLLGSELKFSHNGFPFTRKNVAHLILHGSTKSEEEKKIRFGTGFIVTHLVSKVVQVRGQLDNGKSFDFQLSRDAKDWKELLLLMNDAKRQFDLSLTQKNGSSLQNTEYEYKLNDLGKQTAINGLQSVKDNAPLILALNEQLHSLKVVTQEGESVWTRGDEENSEGPVRIVTINGSSGCAVALANDGPVTVAVLLRKTETLFEIDSMDSVPKL